MADSTVQALSVASSVSSDDKFYMVDDPAGVPADKGVTLAVLQTSLNLAKSNLFNALMNEPTASNYAIIVTRNQHPVLQFSDVTQQSAVFRGRVPATANVAQGCYVYLQWCAVPTTGTVGWDVSFERIVASGLDIDADSWGTAQTVTATTVSGTSGITLQTSAAFTQAQLPASLAVGDQYRVRIRRDVATDTAAGFAQLLQVEVRWA